MDICAREAVHEGGFASECNRQLGTGYQYAEVLPRGVVINGRDMGTDISDDLSCAD
jgi:hypothetical protein